MSAPSSSAADAFPTEVSGLPSWRPAEAVEVDDGETYELRIAPLVHTIGDARVRMLGYNGSIPGPTIRVRQGSHINVRVKNDGDHETTVHWHGLRVVNRFDGVPFDTQEPIAIGGEFTYQLRFLDDGLYWYHPHVREDYGLEMGLYGNFLVDAEDAESWPPVDREAVVTLDDLLMVDGRIAEFSRSGPTYTAMGRFGNVMLIAGQTRLHLEAHAGEVVRFYFTNTANTRIFNVSIPNAHMKLIAGDSGRYEREERVDAVLVAPSERAVVDVLFDEPGDYAIEHKTPYSSYTLGTVVVLGRRTQTPARQAFEEIHTNDALERERLDLGAHLERAPDKTLVLDSLMPLLYGGEPATASSWTCPMHPEIVRDEAGTCPICGMKLVPAVPATVAWTCPMHPQIVRDEPGTCPMCGMKLIPAGAVAGGGDAHGEHQHDHGHADSGDGLEWEDLMEDINARTNAENMIWKLVDADTGLENTAIDWAFNVGDRVKIRIVNTMESDHPMHHPFHVHGAGRFLVLSRGGVTEPNLVWKDTVLIRAGETVDILLEVNNPGRWMAHCHIAEHNQNGMMFTFRVE